MSKLVMIIIILLIATVGGTLLNKSASGEKTDILSEVKQVVAGDNLHKTTLAIDGMWCASCAIGSEYNLKAIDGVSDAHIGFTDSLDGEGWVIYEQGKVSQDQITKAIEPYTVTIVADSVYTE